MKPIEKKESCVYCGCTNVFALTKDHILPKTRGGLDNKENIQICCWWCNQLKGPLTNNEFKIYYKTLVELHKLKKIKVVLPPNLNLKFNQHFHPDWKFETNKKEVIKNE